MRPSKRLMIGSVGVVLLGCLAAAGLEPPEQTISPPIMTQPSDMPYPASTVAQAQETPSPTRQLPIYATRDALDVTATYWSEFYPTLPDPSYTPFGRDCGLLSWYECHVEDWRSFSETATSFAKTTQPVLATPPGTPVP